VLQVVSATYSTVASSSSTTYADTGLSLAITPSSATSKVLCLVVQAGCAKDNGNSENALKLRLVRASTTIYEPMNRGFWTGIDNSIRQFTVTMNYLDSPATTSATTYKTQFANFNASAEVRVQVDSMPSSIVLLEIGA
jgi:type II secretory pathway component GspD/PulD (secretin)